MTKQELELYIAKNGNAELVVKTIKQMHEEGAPMTIEELDNRVHTDVLGSVADFLEKEQSDEEVLRDYLRRTSSYDMDGVIERSQKYQKSKYSSAIIKTYLGYVCLPIFAIISSVMMQHIPEGISSDIWQYVCVGVAAVGWVLFAIAVIMPTAEIFHRAGHPGWTCIIPFVNSFIISKMAWDNGWLFLLTFTPLVGLIISPSIMAALSFIPTAFVLASEFRIATRFGKSTGFAIGYAVLNLIFAPILAYSDAEYS